MNCDFNLTREYRELADYRHKSFYSPRSVNEFVLADARARLETAGSSQAVWKGERCFRRLEAMIPDVAPGEKIVGCPLFNTEPAVLEGALAEAYKSIPPFPGGDNGHMNPDYARVFAFGLRDLAGYIRYSAEVNGGSDFYASAERALSGISEYIKHTAAACREKGMYRQAENCEALVADPPHTFYQALQLLFFVEVCLWYGEDHNLVTPCRLDRLLIAFYERDIKRGILTPEEAFDLLCHFYLQLNNICAPSLALSVIVGGYEKHDSGFVCNDLTYLAIHARVKTALVYPTVGLAWTPDAPEELMDFCCREELEGVGCPSFFNDGVIRAGLLKYGVGSEDASEWMNSTCVEIMPAACANVYVASPYFNCSQILLDVIREAVADE
ncbi:MAG: hypothetical protein IJT95_05400, partial [Abditibacteriota bacterium]|nr:hypothetical protein [Abditibacteriota bacterium]